MADKEKRLRKILAKKGFKGELKLAATLEEARLVWVENFERKSKNIVMDKDTYLRMVEIGYTFIEEDVYYLVSTNPRNSKSIEKRFLSGVTADVKPLCK